MPHLAAPLLPKRALDLLRTPPVPGRSDNADNRQYVTASWGSPYPESEEPNLRGQSPGSELSEDSPVHHLELDTPFLRPAPFLEVTPAEQQSSSLAAILVNRARRPGPARGLTEDWIRQHTAADESVEPRHWLSDGSDSEHSSLSGSQPGDEAAWLDDRDFATPRATRGRVVCRPSPAQHPRAPSSTETLKQAIVDQSRTSVVSDMASPSTAGLAANDGDSVVLTSTPGHRPTTPTTGAASKDAKAPITPTRAETKKDSAPTPRFKKRVPWRGRNIMVLLPKEDETGRFPKRPSPLKEHSVANMFREWEELGYNIRGFDLDEPTAYSALPVEQYSKTRDEWPDNDDMRREWAEHKFKVTLPDMDGDFHLTIPAARSAKLTTPIAWKRYADELMEAKLRALGVSLADDEPPPPPLPPSSISPNPPGPNRRATITQYPPLPFSPPIPTSSTSSQGMHQFPFPGQGGGGSKVVASPTSFGGNFNPQAPTSMPPTSVPQNQSPFGFMPPQPLPSPRDALLQQQGMHRVSPSLSTSPFGQSGFQPPLPHQRHQSLQYPQLPHQQFMSPTIATPQLQELREEDEGEQAKSPSKTPEPGPQVRHNASDSLQREIDEAEYHLEEQFRSQLEHDQDYSPHNENDRIQVADRPTQEPAKQFAPQLPHIERNVDENLELHHPRPHSRGHSLSQKYFGEDDMRANSRTGGFGNLKTIEDDKAEEIETNPRNAGTPILEKFTGGLSHDRTFSNPWQDVQSTSRRPSLDKKPSASSSKFNVTAPEFKFNPTSTFQPGQFNFGSNTFQPAAFQSAFAPRAPESVQSTSSKINVNAPIFSPGSSEFSFSAAGAPTFNPSAPSFTPIHSFSVSGSVASPLLSGSESGKMPSIFGSIDLNKSDIVKPAKESKAIPIVRPSSRPSEKERQHASETDDADGRIPVDASRVKRFRGSSADGDEEIRFAEPTEQTIPAANTPADKGTEDERPGIETTMSSTIVSDSTDAKDTTSLSEVSGDQNALSWAPAELRSEEISDFNAARPFGEDFFKPRHRKSLSASAKPFVPGASFGVFGTTDDEKEVTPVPGYFEESAVEPAGEDVVSPVNENVTEDIPQESIESEPSPLVSHGDSQDVGLDHARFVPSPSPVNKGLRGSRFAASPSPPKGLSASKYARSPSAESDVEVQEPHDALVSSAAADDQEDTQETISQPASPPVIQFEENRQLREPTFEEIDEVMRHINDDPALGVHKTHESPIWQPSPSRPIPIPGAAEDAAEESPIHPRFPVPGADESPKHIHPRLRDHAPSPSPRHYHLPIGVHQPVHSTEHLEDPFLDPPASVQMSRLNTDESQAASDDWERAFSDEEQVKLDSRANFFDGRVNDVVGSILEGRLGPLEKTLAGIHRALASLSDRQLSVRRERRSASADIQESDADDEDEEPLLRRSMSPRRDKRMEQIRAAVMDAFAIQQRSNGSIPPLPPLPPTAGLDAESAQTLTSILNGMEEMKQQFSESLHLDFRGEDLRNVVEEAVQRQLPSIPAQPSVEGQEDIVEKLNELSARYADLEQNLRIEEAKNATEISTRRMADDRAAEFERQLQMTETRLEMEIMNRSSYDQRVAEFEAKLRNQEEITDSEVSLRRAAEDRLAEVQRLLRISSEEEIRLREALEEKDERLKIVDANNSKSTMRLALLEASMENTLNDKADFEHRLNNAEEDARDLRQEVNHWKLEAERAIELSERQGRDLHHASNDNRQLHSLIDTLSTQLNENERVRENWRSKFLSLQDDMARAAHEIAEENARHAKKEQTMLARQEVLDAKLQAESRTRERLEIELERLEAGERQGMKAVNEAKRLEAVLGEMRTENHKLQQTAMRYQAEFQEARESGAREVQRTRESMQAQLEDSNHQVNVVRQELEDEITKLQAQRDQAKLDADTVKSQYDMLMEDARHHSKGDIDEILQKHRDEMEDMQARYERQLSNKTEDAERAESNLLERLSISTSKCEHLQDRVAHLEEKLDIAREAGRAAAQAARASGVASPPVPATVFPPVVQPAAAAQPPVQPAQSNAFAKAMQLPDKISPQALRESIMVLQEQLQEREQKIEDLEQTVAKLDPEAETKIAKRDDEIVWLRELLGVRHSDLQDIITALGRDDYDQDRVRDAAIRLKANLQMEQQERERAMNGGSAVNLPHIAASLRDATPRVAQAVGPLAAALGNWRRGGSFVNAAASSPAARGATANANATPKKDSPVSQSSFLSGLLTPPASNLRQTPGSGSELQQPTAFSSTGRRWTPQDLANRPKPASARQAQKMPVRGGESPIRKPSEQILPQTPPAMRPAAAAYDDVMAYDDDALAQDDFDDAGFFDDE